MSELLPQLLRNLFVNSTILISFITLENQFFHNKFTPASSLYRKIVAGLAAGALGCLLIAFGTDINGVYIDLRVVPIIITAIYLSSESAAAATVIIAVSRVIYGGPGFVSCVAFLFVLIMGAGCILIGRMKIKTGYQWLLSGALVSAFSCVNISLMLGGGSQAAQADTIYIIFLFPTGFLLYLILEKINEFNNMFDRVEKDARKDFLTGLNNVRRFDTLLNSFVGQAKRRGEPLSLLFIDIDFFKKVNDTYGHPEGNLVLNGLGRILEDSCRSMDIVSRNGGEEFSVLLPDCPPDKAMQIAERMRANVESYRFVLENGMTISITISIGVATFPLHAADPNQLLERADMALYSAKREGRNCVRLFTGRKEASVAET